MRNVLDSGLWKHAGIKLMRLKYVEQVVSQACTMKTFVTPPPSPPTSGHLVIYVWVYNVLRKDEITGQSKRWSSSVPFWLCCRSLQPLGFVTHNALSSPNCVMRPKNCCKGNYLWADCGVPFQYFGSWQLTNCPWEGTIFHFFCSLFSASCG